MAHLYPKAYFGNKIIPVTGAKLSVASSAVLYGLSVYTVFPLTKTKRGLAAFRLQNHYARLIASAAIIGIDSFASAWSYRKFENAVGKLIAANTITRDVFVRATVHVDALVPGTRSRGLSSVLSIFMYESPPILTQEGARLKTSVWRRVPDYAIPSRAKVNGAYVNSVLAKQDALDSGYDDSIFLDSAGHVCELSAANIFIVRNGTLITPGVSHDLLEGITRRTILDLARDFKIPVSERDVDLTELYIADEVFASGTSSLIAYAKEIDGRKVGNGKRGPITSLLREAYNKILHGQFEQYREHVTWF